MANSDHASVHALHVYPVKATRGWAPREMAVEPWGPAGDRRWMLTDASGKALTQREEARLALASSEPLPSGGVRVSAPGRTPLDVPVPDPVRTVPVTLFGDKYEAVPAGSGPDAWWSAYLGAEAHLVHMDDPAVRRPVDPDFSEPGQTVSFADGFPLLVTTLASLDALNSLIAQGDLPDEGPLPMNRFRPNVVLDGTAPWAEDGWQRITVGTLSFRVAKPCGRCLVTTTDQTTAERGKEPLRSLASHRRFGNSLVFGQTLIPESRGVLRIGDRVTVEGA
ncbi:MOSC domain-containing protein [Streptomyces sp. NBC_00237]|uniref:MOSC domain-containing protein n=1 Tax=Streptomyces sp. NBC_00237 TaxID=2975687 RepID=UPI00225A5A38|nr:MOSC N-terminal beta barrel domain-containing protein [Streptomyces sp. NBC_00237]MCX5207109.1 MOSC domain-containing protein [Streptomyces sp. NBC_00237]